MYSKKINRQLTATDSGISTLKTIGNYFNYPISSTYIKQQVNTHVKGIPFEEIQFFLNNNGFEASFESFNFWKPEAIKSQLPLIVPVQSKKNYDYLIVVAIKKKKIVVWNPKNGQEEKITMDDFKLLIKFSKLSTNFLNKEQKISAYCEPILAKYQLNYQALLQKEESLSIANKLAYFKYLQHKFGFKNEISAKGFLVEILEDPNYKVPTSFTNNEAQLDALQEKLPLVLAVKITPSTANIPKEVSEKQNIYWRLFKQLKAQKQLWYIYIFVTFFSAITTQLAVFIHQILIDHVLPTFNMSRLIIFTIGLSFYKLFNLFTTVFKKFVGIHLKNTLDFFFLKSFDSKMNQFSLPYIQTFQKGDLLERVSDTMKLKRFFTKFFISIGIDLIIAIYSILILLYLNWQLTLGILFTLIIFYFWFKLITPYLQENEKIRYLRKSAYLSKIIEKIEGLQVLKSFGREAYFSHKVTFAADQYLKIQLKNAYVNLLNTTVVSFLMSGISVIVILVLAKTAITSQAITLGQIITFISLSSKVFGSVKKILNQNLTLQENQIILKRFLDFNELQTPIQKTASTIANFNINSLQLQDVTVSYGNKTVLSQVNFTFTKGEKLLLTGDNGCGKSTFCKILSAITKPASGQVLVNDIPLENFDINNYRQKTSLSTNEDLVFNDTIFENITLGRSISREKILKLAQKIGFSDFINSVKYGLDFEIQGNGKNISTGQRKKIILLRALLSNSEIILLDEVLSGIDLESRLQIEQYINEDPRSFIIISHEPIKHIQFSKKAILQYGKLSIL